MSISEPERDHALTRFPRVPVSCVPFGLDPQRWPVFTTPAEGDFVLVVGNFAESRNAQGLVEVLDEIARSDTPFQLVVASGPGLHPSLEPYRRDGRILHEAPGSLVDTYRRSWVALVPARTVTGQKTTILQAWACGVPVVTTTQCAATVSASGALLAGRNARELVEHLERLRDSPSERRRLAEQGSRTVALRHTEELQTGLISGLLSSLVSQENLRDESG